MKPSATHTNCDIVTISFPELHLRPNHAHKLRGYFGSVFRDHSPLLHNHFADGRLRYGLPLVQYKIVGSMPVLVGIQEGAKLLTELFFQMKSLNIDGREYPVLERDISFKNETVGVGEDLIDYRFATLWMPLNQQNHAEYLSKNDQERKAFLGRILTGNILSFFKGISLYLPEGVRVMTTVRPKEEKLTGFKDQLMIGISGGFTTNAILPDLIGLGKSVARGYGTLERSI